MASNGSEDRGPSPLLGRGSQRERLLDGIARSVARHGYAGTPVAEILSAAGVSRRTFYEQFVDKEDCFLAAYDTIVALCTERVIVGYHAGGTWEDGISHAYRALLGTLAAEPDFAYLGVVAILGAGPRALERRDATLRRFARFVDYTRERTEVATAPPRLVGRAIVGGIHELVYAQIVAGETTRLPELTNELLHYTSMLLGVSLPAAE